MTTTQQTQQQGIKVPSEVLPSDGMSRFVRAGAWAALVSGVALIVSMLLEWLVVPYERLGLTEAYFTSAIAYPPGCACSASSCWCGGSSASTGPSRERLAPSGCGRSSWSSWARHSQWATSGRRCSFTPRLRS
jgi:hypothetical protein